ncbi:cobalamin-dependent protein [Maritalea porphyrae]|uniref:cobalamin-dependent protein n=1 Tax=Maritalea porphyrae TaxID=880732 RepID=UPI0022B0257A|nr:cobalamin-dependent protein [Maritalea porphyrae]MCZ4272490.1 hypothetical protein [Maritalea porphyrae]
MMATEQFLHKIETIKSSALPAMGVLFEQSAQIADGLRVGRTAAMDAWDVSSELEFKQACMKQNKITYHAHIGMGSWQLTEDALGFVDRELKSRGFAVHRAGLCLDRRMALPEKLRLGAAAETGPMLESQADWQRIGQNTPIQPHMGDFMIGFPSSVTNSVLALRAGVTTIGNLSQYFAHQAPGWHDHIHTAVETTKAIALLGRFRDQGVALHSYLEDGYGALFFDCATIAGWAMLEHYIVEELLGAKLSHCIGGLTSDPIKRAGWVFALDKIHKGKCVGSMFYGDTISFTQDFDENRGMIAEYMLWDIMAQLKCPTGHAVLPLPVTEAVRAPSAQEIVEAQILGNRVEKTARHLVDKVDFSEAEAFADTIVKEGRGIFERALHGFKEAGIDVRNPLQMLYALKEIGPALFEEIFGAGAEDPSQPRNRIPTVPTDIFAQSIGTYKQHLPAFSKPKVVDRIAGKRLLLASSDVHEHALLVLNWLLDSGGANVVNLGAEVDAQTIVARAKEDDVDAILVSTHNGMALDFGKTINAEMAKQSIKKPVLFGGVLNQKIQDQELPVDVSSELRAIGIHANTSSLEQRLVHFLQLEKQ